MSEAPPEGGFLSNRRIATNFGRPLNGIPTSITYNFSFRSAEPGMGSPLAERRIGTMRVSISLKLAVAFTILTALAATVSWLGISSLRSSNATLLELINGPVVRLQQADELQLAIMNIAPSEKNMIMAATPEEVRTIAAELVRRQTVSAAREAGGMLAKLVPDIKKTAELVEEISAACREQDIGANQVNQAIQQLDKVIQQNAGAAEEMSATSEALSGQAETLQSSIAFFRIGGDAAPAPAASRTKAVAPTKAEPMRGLPVSVH